MIKINVILGTSRPAARGRNLFNYFRLQQEQFEQQFKVNLNLIELSDLHLPFFYEDEPPLGNQNRTLPPNEAQWVNQMAAADGYLILTPEYNHSFPAVLKNALDFLGEEPRGKATKVITYADNARGGQWAFNALLPVLTRMNFFVLPHLTSIAKVATHWQPDGKWQPDDPKQAVFEHRISTAVQEAAFYTKLLADHPFSSN
ncbi:putative reductase [Fructilactobacillus florum 8D]|uniref:Putative reductase n=1 Tax=Fructilactobacillus florum 8D TaxID=1221538 RepID=W9EDR5_9LACO|nr:NAD(P)H-dependent oxidoreductase [Fructilactobacillus florum]EKK20144.1 putative reductase [Fructilactobacillus florum 2F]ETO40227.1 putative reductase [Fructilactobacillus florum 8D]